MGKPWTQRRNPMIESDEDFLTPEEIDLIYRHSEPYKQAIEHLQKRIAELEKENAELREDNAIFRLDYDREEPKP